MKDYAELTAKQEKLRNELVGCKRMLETGCRSLLSFTYDHIAKEYRAFAEELIDIDLQVMELLYKPDVEKKVPLETLNLPVWKAETLNLPVRKIKV